MRLSPKLAWAWARTPVCAWAVQTAARCWLHAAGADSQGSAHQNASHLATSRAGAGPHLSLAGRAAGYPGPRPARDRRRAERGGGGAWREPRPTPGQLTGCSNAGAHFAVRSSEAVVSRRLRPWRRCGRRRRRWTCRLSRVRCRGLPVGAEDPVRKRWGPQGGWGTQAAILARAATLPRYSQVCSGLREPPHCGGSLDPRPRGWAAAPEAAVLAASFLLSSPDLNFAARESVRQLPAGHSQ